MKKWFFGGVHPEEKKDLTCQKELVWGVEPDYITIPLRQHIGSAGQPLVKAGDYVFRGQKIGDGEGLCVPIHASVSGTVEAIQRMPHPNGEEEPSFIIKNDKKYAMAKDDERESITDNMDSHALFRMVREAGIAGMGGATFPTEKKLLSAMEKADTMIINGCECEPYITADDMVMRNWPEKVLKGVQILQKALKPKRTVLAIEDNKSAAIETIKKHLTEAGGIELAVLPTRYPQGAEKQLIQAVTGRELPPGKFPAEIGCVVFNVTTVWSVYRAVKEGMPLIERIVTVSGNGIEHPANYMVPIGTSFSDLVDAAGGIKKGTDRVIAGGPMMGRTQKSLEVPVTKGVGAVICLLGEEKKQKGGICIRCGKCVEVCPVRLQPLYLYRNGKAGNIKKLEQYHLMDCIECGCCSYICPAKLPLTEQFCKDKKLIRKERNK